jgi:hypothetical protein
MHVGDGVGAEERHRDNGRSLGDRVVVESGRGEDRISNGGRRVQSWRRASRRYSELEGLKSWMTAGASAQAFGATERGAGLLLGGESDPTYVQVLAEGPSTSLKLSNKDGRVQLIKP